MAAKKQLESVGWLFWGVTFAVLAGPVVYGTFQVVYEDTPTVNVVGIGLVIAAVAAATVTATINTVLQRSAEKRRLAERKSKKAKK